MSNKKSPYLLIGNGRLAKHFNHYLNLLSIPHLHWWRSASSDLQSLIRQSDKILVLINDDAIESFVEQHKSRTENQLWIHCSGSLETTLAEGVHPLMTFGDTLYDLTTYQSMPFMTTRGRRSFHELFPELINPYSTISSKKRALYHAWASMAGNFSSMIWSEYFQRLEKDFGLNSQLAIPYLNQIFKNIKNSQTPLTGPLLRGDDHTINAHLDSLHNDAFKGIYSAFTEAYRRTASLKELT
ncbi:MAG: DUF2520 domain-containing protein [Candidatus Marinimicrobia bacterium]|nr:DUF2520 domain-containing protein [Candidatus Neomarinimicrobiota bacterium]